MNGIDPDVDGIYTMRIDDLHLERLTTSPFHFTEGSAGMCGGGENRGVYSPDGTQIAYVRQKCGLGPNPSADESAAIELMAAGRYGATRARRTGRGQKPSRFADLMVAGWYEDCVR